MPKKKRRKMILTILITLVSLLAILLIVIALQPADYQVTRSATINAPPAVAFAQVNDLHNWEGWSPWAKLDPAMRQTYEGAPAGVGAIYTWAGNRGVGQGTMTITESKPGEKVDVRVTFIKPFAGLGLTEFTFKPLREQTVVTWTMTGKKNFIAKAGGLFLSMDKLIGGQFASGLTALKNIAEARK